MKEILCAKCRAVLTEENTCPSTFKRGSGRCHNCDKEKCRKYKQLYPERASVRSHFSYIFIEKRLTYKYMPFFDGWNPVKGGSFNDGARWIIENLGKRPKGCSLHIVEHEKGFVPGNLEWADSKKQSSEQMFKIIARQKHCIHELEEQIKLIASGIK